MLGAVLVHPDLKEVIPLAPEPISAGRQTKNDCERNATRRWLQTVPPGTSPPEGDRRRGRLGPTPRTCGTSRSTCHFILGVKPGDHAFLFEHLRARDEAGQCRPSPWSIRRRACSITFASAMPCR